MISISGLKKNVHDSVPLVCAAGPVSPGPRWRRRSGAAGCGAKTAVDHRRTSSPEAPTSEMLNSNQIEKNMHTARLNFEFLRGTLDCEM